MTLKVKSLFISVIFLLFSLACSSIDSVPADDQSLFPMPTQTTDGNLSLSGELETVVVSLVVDGDTIELADGRRIRYIGINTPERDQPYYKDATDANRQLVEGKRAQLEFDVDTFDQYGRTLAYIWVDGLMANLEITRLGFANVFTVPPNVKYVTEFREAEQAAREAERGLWAGAGVALKIVHIEANAPGSDQENPNGEWVEIVNRGSVPVTMSGYTLKDEANHIYTFSEVSVQPGKTLKLHSGQGQDRAETLYWGLVGDSVWNNDGDTAFLRDAKGALVDSFAY